VYRPQNLHVWMKPDSGLANYLRSAAPPVHRPTAQRVSSPPVFRPSVPATQMKPAAPPGALGRSEAPPLYRPQNPHAQMKPSSGPAHSALSAAVPIYCPAKTASKAPPVYRPNSVASLQSKQGIAAPPAYRRQPVQQPRAGRVRNPVGSGDAVLQDRNLEAKADRMGTNVVTSVLQRKTVPGVQLLGERLPGASHPLSFHTGVIQQAGWGTWVALGAVGTLGVATLGLPMVLGAAVVGAGLKLAYENRTGNKIDKEVFIGPDESREEIKKDVDAGMRKIQQAFTSGVFKDLQLMEQGRDEPVYAFRQWILRAGLGKLIRGWNDSWTIEETAGLLLDAGSKIKQKPEFLEEHKSKSPEGGRPNLLSDIHDSVRKQDKKFKLKGTSEEAVWARGIDRDFRVNAGPSATTATLLNFLSIFPITKEEREAIMQAVILFWRGKIKRVVGDYHTGAEVWMAYTRRLEIERSGSI